MTAPSDVKAFYASRAETNWTKRYASPHALRRYFSRTMWNLVADAVEGVPLLADVGCGDGVLSVLLALRDPTRRVLAMDISPVSVHRAREAAAASGVADRIAFVVGDAERLPFTDGSLPAVVSCQVLEHLPDFDKGVRELQRVLSPGGRGVVAIPTCLNPGAMVLLGGDNYWRIGRATPYAFLTGLLRVALAWIRRAEGVQEGYGGHMEMPHVRRFPWKSIDRIERNGVEVTDWHADSLLIPYLAYLFPPLIRIQQRLDARLRRHRLGRHFGMGIIVRFRKRERQ
ncbi:MAG: class I SAM-dependent methyltransferase [bacterium]|nr:class I SAM-dependent methyltransferase [bacterium]